MFNFKQIAAAVAMGGVVVSAAAETTGNAGVVSEYMFRGLESSNGAAVQGGIDWAHDSGLTVGTWASNAVAGGDNNSTELDVYAGFNGKFGDFGYEAGAIYYYFPEFDEGNANGNDISYPELYLGGSVGPLLVRAYFSNDYFGTDEDGTYVMGTFVHAVSQTVSASVQVGFASGDGVKSANQANGQAAEEYTDYSIGVTKALDDGMGLSLSLVGTDLDAANGESDGPKVVIGLKKNFAF